MSEAHEILGGKVQVYKRGDGQYWQCSASVGSRQHRKSTGEESLAQAKEFAEDWYLGLRAKLRTGELTRKKKEKTFREAAEQFEREYEIITGGQRGAKHIEMTKMRLKVHLVPFFGDLGLSEITSGKIQDYRIHRYQQGRRRQKPLAEGEKEVIVPPARSTLHQEMVALRQTLKAALRQGWLQYLPDMSEPYRASGKIAHRAWFSPDEYKQLYTATRERARNPKNPRYKWDSEQFHDYVLFMANTGVRPDEAYRLQFRDVVIVEDEGSNETILEIEVRGKRGVGYCKSTAGAVKPFERLRDRLRKTRSADGSIELKKPQPTDLLFPTRQHELLNAILAEENLKKDREGQIRTAYSLRHTYICLRLMEGADIYQIAKNCRTSVEMIEKYYASHIKNNLDASAINVRRKKVTRVGEQKETILQEV